MSTHVKNKHSLILVAIIALAIVLRLIFFTGMKGSDDLQYNYDAYSFLADGINNVPDHLTKVRLLSYVPVSLFFNLFGINELSSILYPFICSMGILLLVYKFGVLLFDRKTALIAAFLYAILPIEIMFSTMLYPEMPMCLYAGLSVYLLMYYFEISDQKKQYLLFLSGVCIGCACLVKITALMLVGFFFLYFIFIRRELLKNHILYCASGLFTVFLIEAFYYYYNMGDFIYRYHFLHLESHHVNKDIINHIMSFPGRSYMGWERAIKYYPSIIFNPLSPFSVYYYVVLIAIAYFFWQRKKEAYYIILWLLVVFGVFNFGITSMSPLVFIPAAPRYLMPTSIPLVLLVGYFLALPGSSKWKVMKLVITTFLILTTAWDLKFCYSGGRNLTYNSREIKKFMISRNNIPVYTDDRTSTILYYLNGYKEYYPIRSINNIDNEMLKSVSNCYIVLNWARINKYKTYYNWELPGAIYDPPSNWKLAKVIEHPPSKHRGTGIVVGLRKILGLESETVTKQKSRKVTHGENKDVYIYYATEP